MHVIIIIIIITFINIVNNCFSIEFYITGLIKFEGTKGKRLPRAKQRKQLMDGAKKRLNRELLPPLWTP